VTIPGPVREPYTSLHEGRLKVYLHDKIACLEARLINIISAANTPSRLIMDLMYIFNHVFLPPELPQKDDNDFSNGLRLIEELQLALISFQGYLPDHQRPHWSPCVRMVSQMLEIRGQFGSLSTQALENCLNSMLDGGKFPCNHNAETVLTAVSS
jgi:hypothetical protein